MAGIGFVLRKLTKRDDLLGLAEAYFHAIIASSGPWLMTIIAVWAFFFIGEYWNITSKIEQFRVIILYNFSFSLVLTAPVVMVSTRYLADCIYREDLHEAVGLLIGALSLQFLITFPLAVWFYFFAVLLPPEMAALSVVSFLLISGIWITMVFISSLKYYSGISISFLVGVIFSFLFSYIFSGIFGDIGLLLGFNLGMGFIFVSFLALIFSEYPIRVEKEFGFMHYFHKYWQVALSGTFYNLAIWVDKWMMWFAPERRELPSHMVIYPEYDISMFVAYLMVIPAMALFLLAQETSFFEKYVTFYRGIVQHDSLAKIKANHSSLMKTVMYHARNLMVIQGVICFFTLLLAPVIMTAMGMNLLQVSMFRYGVLGASFQVLALFMVIVLSYFDERRLVLLINAFFFGTNVLFTWVTIQLGFPFYGLGFCLSAIFTFVLVIVLYERFVRLLPYHTFITRNLHMLRS